MEESRDSQKKPGNASHIVVNFPKDEEGIKERRFVLWIDIMGIQNSLRTSLGRSANHILRLHIAINKSINSSELKGKDIQIFPVMDGAYVVSEEWESMTVFVNKLFTILARNFIYYANSEPGKILDKTFLVRAAIAYGFTVEGKKITDLEKPVNTEITKNSEYFKRILFALPMIQAYQGERNAPPFGIFVDDTVRTVEKVPTLWYEWWHGSKTISDLIPELTKLGKKYFEEAGKHSHRIDYPAEKINRHLELFKEYFHVEDSK